jgi:lactoylglutathione lyase
MTKLVGINHVALEVGDVDEALEFYASLFEFELRGRAAGGAIAFIDIGDQFLALQEGRRQPRDESRHFGLVVDDKEATRDAIKRLGVETAPSRPGGLAFFDPWGNHVEVVDYRDVQFERTPGVKRALGIASLSKTDEARAEIDDRGLS